MSALIQVILLIDGSRAVLSNSQAVSVGAAPTMCHEFSATGPAQFLAASQCKRSTGDRCNRSGKARGIQWHSSEVA